MNFIETYKKRYPRRKGMFNRLDHVGIKDWSDLTDDNLRILVDLMSDDPKISQSTIKVYLAELKALMGYYEDKVESKLYKKLLTAKGDASQATFLTESDIEAIDQYVPKTSIERYVKKMFLRSCLTGLRHSDAINLSISNINAVTERIEYVPKKTSHSGTKIVVPVHKLLRKYLQKDDGDDREMFDATFNDTIRRICKRCGINEKITLYRKGETTTAPKWKFVASHTARRSFATNLYLRGVPVDTIAQLMGHTDGKMTNKYIVGLRECDDTVLSFFL